jgi:hypothetical protein
MSDIPSIGSAVGYQQALLAQKVQIAMLAKSNDVMKSEGEAMVEMIQSAMDASSAATSSSSLDVVG